MFEPMEKPHLFGVPPGADFPAVLVENILAAYQNKPPEDLARLRIIVNTRRMERRLRHIFGEGGARLLPKISMVTDLGALLPGSDWPQSVSRLRRKLELTQLTTRLIETDPKLAARSAAVDLADSLAALMDEMQGEGVNPDQLRALDVGDVSEHWERSLRFLDIVETYLATLTPNGLDEDGRRLRCVEAIRDVWKVHPPTDPIIIAGSTGSRLSTRMLMHAITTLPQGALVLPGFDFDLPDTIWRDLSEARASEDHPQYRIASLLAKLGLAKKDVVRWGKPPDSARNRLISLTLRPSQVTDQWLAEGPGLGSLDAATTGLSLIEASQPKLEASAIAIALRQAVEDGQVSALITPDRTLARRISAIMARWNIIPDDSAGVPLSFTPPGRFLRQVARIIGAPCKPGDLIALLKQPLCLAGAGDRGPHLMAVRKLELFCRKNSVFVITADVLAEFQDRMPQDEAWIAWLSRVIDDLARPPKPILDACVTRHIGLSETLSHFEAEDTGELWETSAGRSCKALIQGFSGESDFDGHVPFADYLRLFEKALAAESDRDRDNVHPNVMIWGTLEARVQGADLVVLGGLNEGTWPEPSNPDPWLNRQMRRDLGLLLPESQVGLAAHDYQQAIAAEHVILSRSHRGEDGEAVPSRWLNRLTNLLEGLPDQGGPEALRAMKARGDAFLDLAHRLDRPSYTVDAEPRPAPAPPVKKRPKKLSVTEISTLIRDPYAIYAKHVLGLRPLMPLDPKPDGRLKGIVFHDILEAFFAPSIDMRDEDSAKETLSRISDETLAKNVPWAATRSHWRGQLAQISDHLIESENHRRDVGQRVGAEVKGVLKFSGAGVSITGIADRIDRLNTGDLIIYDYKSGTVPTPRQVRYFDRQLLIEAVMAEEGGFDDLPRAAVDRVVHLHLGRRPKDGQIELEEGYETVTVSGELAELLAKYGTLETGYISRRAMEKVRYEGDYDHLARFGEWDASIETTPMVIE